MTVSLVRQISSVKRQGGDWAQRNLTFVDHSSVPDSVLAASSSQIRVCAVLLALVSKDEPGLLLVVTGGNNFYVRI